VSINDVIMYSISLYFMCLLFLLISAIFQNLSIFEGTEMYVSNFRIVLVLYEIEVEAHIR